MSPLGQADSYTVRLPVFEGPLDLLLHLIEREKLDISTISLAQVTEQFLGYVRELAAVQPAILADFLAMAARLVWIKSRLLLPQPAKANAEEEEDPGEALARQLREYKRFKQAAAALQALADSGGHCYVRVAGRPEIERRVDRMDLTMADFLAAALAAFAEEEPPAPPVGTVVAPFKLTIRDQIKLIARTTWGGRPTTFRGLLRSPGQRVEVAVTLLAVLELIKRRQLHAEQSHLFGEIVITRAPDATLGEDGELPPERGEAVEENGSDGEEW